MTFPDLRSFIRHLEAVGQLLRIKAPVDPNQEITIIHHRVMAARGPALLFENPIGCRRPLITNLYGTPERVALAFGADPVEIGARIGRFMDALLSRKLSSLWNERRMAWNMRNVRLRRALNGPVMETLQEPPNLNDIPCLTCWPLDGGAFFTLPLVYTQHPDTGVGNLGIYRMQRYDATSTGMHWQIEKGGGFHFNVARRLNRPLPISVTLGGPPALLISAIAPLPENVDERLLAAFLMNQPLDVINRAESGHAIPAQAELVIEGEVIPGDERREGPFGDHLGHYSHSADFPVFRAKRILARRDAVIPATVVGKPCQEDYFLGNALQEMTLPILRHTHAGIADLWAYPETGFHPLAVAAVDERYRHEALKHAFALLGFGQISLTKILIATDAGTPIRDFSKVSDALWRNFDSRDSLHLLSPTAQDTLDFTGPAINRGSRLILLATSRPQGPLRTAPPPPPPPARDIHPALRDSRAIGHAIFMAQATATADRADVHRALLANPATRQYLFHVLVSEDVPVHDPILSLWGWFTRFDPQADIHPAARTPDRNRLVLETPILIDARWKEGYRLPVAYAPDIEARVNRNWQQYGLKD